MKKVNCILYLLPVGMGRISYVDGYRVGGKTGTAQKVGSNWQYMQGNYILSLVVSNNL